MKTIKLIFIYVLFLFPFYSYSQDLKWAKSIGDTLKDYGNAIEYDDSGNIFVLGSFQGTVDFDPGQGTYKMTAAGTNYDIFILKLDTSGNFIWAKKFGSNGYDIGAGLALDSLGNIYITGGFSGTVDFDPGSGINNLTGFKFGYHDIYVLKLDVSGDFVWVRQLGGQSDEFAYAIAVDRKGNVYTTGYFLETADFDPGPGVYNIKANGSLALNKDIFVSKLNADGGFVWVKNYGESMSDEALAMVIDSMNNIYITGYFYSKINFDPSNQSSELKAPGNDNIFIVKLNEDGKYIWSKNFGGSTYDMGYSIALDESGYIYCTGSFGLTADFDPGAGTYNLIAPGVGLRDVFILKLNPDGNLIWAKRMGGIKEDYGFSIDVNDFGEVYVTGYFSDAVDINLGIEVENVVSEGLEDIFILKLDKDGNFIWYKILGGTGADFGRGVAVGPNGNYSITGSFQKKMDVYIGNKGYSMTSRGNNDILISCSKSCFLPIKTQPASQRINPGNKTQLNVKAGPTASYQWQERVGYYFTNLSNSSLYSGVKKDTLKIDGSNLTRSINYYRCIVSEGDCSEATINVVLKVDCVFKIISHPENQNIDEGSKVLFRVVSSTPSSTYQWQENSGSGFVNISNGGQYSGVTNDTLTINSVTFSQNAYSYRCKVLDNGCSDSSGNALLTVKEKVGYPKLYIEKNIRVHSNPAHTNIIIQSDYTLADTPFLILDQLGKEILNGKLNGKLGGIDISSLSTGLYYLKIGENQTRTYKIIKN